jgi:hypothetical protein
MPIIGQRFQPCAPRRNNGKLRHGKEAINEDKNKNDEEFAKQ